MSNNICVSRPAEGLSINAGFREYLLDSENELRCFPSEEAARTALTEELQLTDDDFDPLTGLRFHYLHDIRALHDAHEENDALAETIQDAHMALNNLGAGKEHWGLEGRIRALVFIWARRMNDEQRKQKLVENFFPDDWL